MSHPLPTPARAFAARMRERFGLRLREVRLYGSYARGEAHEESDIDVLALVDDLSWREKVESVELAAEISLPVGPFLSAVVMSSAEFARLLSLELGYAENVQREGIAL